MQSELFHDCTPGLIKMLSLGIKRRLYLPGQVILTRGDVDHHLFYVQKGTLEVLSAADDETPIACLTKGAVFAEINLFYSMPRTYTIRGVTFCELLTLNQRSLDEALRYYPECKYLQRSYMYMYKLIASHKR